MRYIKVSAPSSQRHFLLIGGTCACLIIVMLLSFTHAFNGLFGTSFISVIASFIMTCIICAIYWLNLISLEPHTLPYDKTQGRGSFRVSLGIRIFVIVLFGFFVAKLFETYLFGWLVDEQVLELEFGELVDLSHGELLGEPHYFYSRIELLNITYPWVWLITLAIIGMFLFPIRKKYELRRHQEYFNLKRVTEQELVKAEYRRFMVEYNLIFARFDAQLQAGSMDKIRYKARPYKDAPFNTRRLPKFQAATHDDFINDLP